jgi:signal transduction histidine kinase/ligand-binding sensor domain-containing protein
LKKSLPKLKRQLSSNLILLCILLLDSLIFISCSHQPPDQRKNEDAKKPEANNTINKDSFSAAKITHLTAANMPKVLKAGNPIVRIDSSKGGAPFFTNYDTEQGLALSEITCSLADRAGNLWFGTAGGGACRYDGKGFTNYSTNQGLASNTVRCIMEDKEGGIWFGTNGNGASRYDGKCFTSFTTDQGLVGNNVRSLLEARNGAIWFGTDAGASKFDGKRFTSYTTAQGLAGNNVDCIMQDRAGDLWFGTYGGGASRYDGKLFTNYTAALGLADNKVSSIIQDRVGEIWFGTEEGSVSSYDGKNFKNYSKSQGLPGGKVRSMMQDRTGDIWFCTSNGVCRFDGKGFSSYRTDQGLAGNDVYSISEGIDGEIWFGTFGGGISRYDGKCFKRFTTAQGLAGNLVYSILQDRDGNIWSGTDGGGVSKYDGKTFTNYSTIQGLAGNSIWSIIQDRDGDIWFGGNSEVSRFDGKRFTTFSKNQGLPDYSIWSMIQDKEGCIWFGTDGGGACRYDGKSFTSYTTSQGLAGNLVMSIIQDRNGNIWFGTNGNGVSKYDGKSFTNYTTIQGLASNSVYCIIQDRMGNIWIGTEGSGVSRYNGKSFTNYTTSQGLADNAIYAIAEDTFRHIIWFGTNLGLSGFRQNPSSNPDSAGYLFENFNKNTGYPVKDPNNNALMLDKSGILWTGCGDNKLIRFDYDAVNKNREPLALQIQNIKINNENVCWNDLLQRTQKKKTKDSLIVLNEMITTFGKVLSTTVLDSMREKYGDIHFDSVDGFYPIPHGIELPYGDNNLSFDFAAIEPARPKQVGYQYKLDGYDKDWSPLNNNTSVTYGNIAEGNYTFNLRAISPYGIWSKTEYRFSVLPPWQRTWLAYTVYLLLFLGLLWSFIYYRSRKLRRENRILEEKVSHRTEQLKQSLEELKSTQSQLIQSEKMASLGELTAGIAHEIQNPLNFVNNFSEMNKELLAEMNEEIQKGNYDEVKALAKDVTENEEKINHHGKRADAIVKGMLQHSRTKSGMKEPTDINALAEEYLRLVYYGLRAKNNSFHAILHTEFDNAVGRINIIPQDIGKVFLNIYNNSFYAISEKKKKVREGYDPTVSIITKKINDKVEIKIRDNGNGIPVRLVDKIFQPFFTTKPAGEGTGLGLSLSYDILKAHGGEIKVNTRENEFTEITIYLPFSI